jgi:hypothetical protein
MGELRCVDGSLLGVAAIPCRDRTGQPYDVTLRLVRDCQPFAVVGQRCGRQLASFAADIQAAREDPEQASCWPDPDDRFPSPPGLVTFQPGEREYFTLRSRDRGDLPGTGELRCVLRSSADWHTAARTAHGVSPGHWRLRRRAIFEAWSERGTGVRAVLTSAELVRFLDNVLREPDSAALARSSSAASTAGEHLGWLNWPAWRQRGRVPDGSARSRLPALRAAARGVALAIGGPQARGSDVRR